MRRFDKNRGESIGTDIMKKCAGMDPQNWKFSDIAEYPCPKCSAKVEIWKSDIRVKCASCGELIENPRIGESCLSWCKGAAACIGNKDKEVGMAGDQGAFAGAGSEGPSGGNGEVRSYRFGIEGDKFSFKSPG